MNNSVSQYALVMTEPDPSWNVIQLAEKWPGFLKRVTSLEPPCKRITKIHENVWRIPLQDGSLRLGQIIAAAGEYGVHLHILVLNESVQWIKSPPDGGKK